MLINDLLILSPFQVIILLEKVTITHKILISHSLCIAYNYYSGDIILSQTLIIGGYLFLFHENNNKVLFCGYLIILVADVKLLNSVNYRIVLSTTHFPYHRHKSSVDFWQRAKVYLIDIVIIILSIRINRT